MGKAILFLAQVLVRVNQRRAPYFRENLRLQIVRARRRFRRCEHGLAARSTSQQRGGARGSG